MGEFTGLWGRATEPERDQIREFVAATTQTAQTRKFKPLAIEVLRFLNLKTGRSYREVDANLKPIIDRLRSGITVQQLKGIIAKKSREWVGTDREEYLRPATLFNKTKAEQYLGELGK